MPSCLLLPHGAYSLATAVFTTMGWLAALFQKSCNYAKLTGDNLEEIFAGVPVDTPYVEVGLQAYRIPNFNVDTDSYNPEFIGKCLLYPEDETAMIMDGYWKAAKAFSFIALVLGGGATFYLWISTCCRFSRPSWRWAGYEVAAACLFQCLAFLWFQTALCQQYTCSLFYGSKADIMASVFWLVAAVMIFVHYPKPKELPEQQDGIIVSDEEEEEQRRSSGRTTQTRRDELSPPSQELPKLRVGRDDVEMAAGEDSQQDGQRTAKDLDDVELT